MHAHSGSLQLTGIESPLRTPGGSGGGASLLEPKIPEPKFLLPPRAKPHRLAEKSELVKIEGKV